MLEINEYVGKENIKVINKKEILKETKCTDLDKKDNEESNEDIKND